MITSAGTKGTYAYEKLIETFIQSIIAPESAFVWGCDYRVPMMHGLLNRKFIPSFLANKDKISFVCFILACC